MKHKCLFGDICPFDDCDQCEDYSPVDPDGMDELPLNSYQAQWREQWNRMIEAGGRE